MAELIYDYLQKEYNIDSKIISLSKEAEGLIAGRVAEIDGVGEYNQLKVLHAMQKNRLSDVHFAATTGYGYNDLGRDTLEQIYADVFRAEAALVRPQIISGTHALTLALFGNLRYGDELLSPVGRPYDTLQGVIGIRKTKGSLAEHGIAYREVDLLPGGGFDYDGIKAAVNDKTKMVTIQRSKGYTLRHSLLMPEIKALIEFIRNIKSDVIIMVDNCYGEFVDIIEPCEVGADLAVGSLIKNPGGGLAPVGGYIAGMEAYVDNASYKLSSPGIGKEAGPSLGITPQLTQGLFLAPSVVASSLKNVLFASKIFELLGFETTPGSTEERGDIVQAILMKKPENVISFCKGIQMAAPVDSYVSPEPWDMPGYDCQVIMAAGAFIQGSSIELSADAPIKPPYAVFLQGGLTWYHGKAGVLIALNNMLAEGRIKL